MLYIYLDQFAWVFLSEADHSRPGSERFNAVLTLACAAVERGHACFPLSFAHYRETHNQFRAAVRARRASTMRKLSGGISLTSTDDVLMEELDRALLKWFGRPKIPRTCQKFGVGAAHSFGKENFVYKTPAEAPLTPEQRAAFERMATEHLEHALLAHGRRGDAEIDPRFAGPALRYQEGQRSIVEQLRQQKLNDKDLRIAATGLGLIDIHKPLVYALMRAGISFDHEFMALGRDGFVAFLQDLPSRHVDTELHYQHYRNPGLEFQKGHLMDVSALDVAVPYCDVVVTEKRWRDLLTRSGLADRYRTVVISDLNDLVPILLNAAAPS